MFIEAVTITNVFFLGVHNGIVTFIKILIELIVKVFAYSMIFAIAYEFFCRVMVFANNWNERYQQRPQIPKVKKEKTKKCCGCICSCNKPAADIVDLSETEVVNEEEEEKEDMVEEIINRG